MIIQVLGFCHLWDSGGFSMPVFVTVPSNKTKQNKKPYFFKKEENTLLYTVVWMNIRNVTWSYRTLNYPHILEEKEEFPLDIVWLKIALISIKRKTITYMHCWHCLALIQNNWLLKHVSVFSFMNCASVNAPYINQIFILKY